MTLKTKFGHELMSKFWLKVYPNLQGENGQVSPKINKTERWPKSRPKVINLRNKSQSAIFCGPKTVTFAKSAHF